MALGKQEVSLVFTEGVDTKTDNKISTKLSVLENAFIGQESTIKKRNGFDELNKQILNPSAHGLTSPIDSGEMLFTHKNQLGLINNKEVLTYNDQNSAKWYSPNTQAPNHEIEIEAINFPQMSGTPRGLQAVQGPSDVVICQNMISDSGGYLSSIIRKNINDGSIIAQSRVDTFSDKADGGRICTLSGKVYYFIKDSGSETITYFDVSTYSATITPVTLVTDALASKEYEVFVVNNLIVLMYVETGGKLKVVTYNSSMTQQAAFTNSTESRAIFGNFCIDWSPATSLYLVAYVTDSGTEVFRSTLNLTAGLVLSGTITSSGLGTGGVDTSSPARVGVAYDSTISDFYVYYEFLISLQGFRLFAYQGKTLTSRGVVNGGRIAAFPYSISGAVEIAIRISDGLTERTILTNATLAPISILSMETLPVSVEGMGIYSASLGIPLAASQYGSSIVLVRTSSLKGSSPREIQDETFVAIGSGYAFDGATYSECGFLTAPLVTSVSQSPGAGSVPAGTYRYALTFSYTDLSGNVHESAPTFTSDVVLASPKNVTIGTGITTSRRSRDINKVKLYRRDTDQIYKLCAEKTFTEVVSTGSITDSDPSVANQATLYTTGGVLENDPPPPCNIFTTHGDRVFVVNEERPVEIYFSKKTQAGEGIHFSSFLFFSVNENRSARYERVTGLGSLDDKLVIFKDNSLYVVFGDGPNALGVGAFSDPKLVSADVGCRDARSITLTSQGLIFMSSKGIHLLTRSLEVVYIGADVEAYNTQEITSACLLPLLNQVRFTTRNGVSLVYSYYYNQWSWFTNYSAQHSVVWKNRVSHLKTNGSVRVESDGFLDVSTPITIKIITNWIKAAGVQNLQRITRLQFIGVYKNVHKVLVKISYDYEDYAWDNVTVTPLSTGYNTTTKPDIVDVYNGTNNGTYDYEIQLSRQKCESLKIELSDFDQTGESFSLTGMSFISGIKKGLNKLTNNKKF